MPIVASMCTTSGGSVAGMHTAHDRMTFLTTGRTMRRLTLICCATLSAVMATATPANSQQRSFTLRGGGTGVFLDGAADHTMILRPTDDGGWRLECIRGDRHDAAAFLRSGDRVAPPASNLDERDDDGRLARAAVTAGMRFDPDAPTGVDDAGRVLLYMPKPIEPGSSGSHFDRTASPDLLMEPTISPDLLFDEVDLTDAALRDTGWRSGKFRSEVRFTDDAESGFNDPVLGPARRAALRFMVRVWGGCSAARRRSRSTRGSRICRARSPRERRWRKRVRCSCSRTSPAACRMSGIRDRRRSRSSAPT